MYTVTSYIHVHVKSAMQILTALSHAQHNSANYDHVCVQ